MNDDKPSDWGEHLQRTLEAIEASSTRWSDLLPRVIQKVVEDNEAISSQLEKVVKGQEVLTQEIRETHTSARREERKRVAMELIPIYDTCRSIRLELAAYRTGDRFFGEVVTPMARHFEQISNQTRQAMIACGVEVRDAGNEFDPQFDTAAKVEAVERAEEHMRVLKVMAPGYAWADGSGILRLRHVAVGQIPGG